MGTVLNTTCHIMCLVFNYLWHINVSAKPITGEKASATIKFSTFHKTSRAGAPCRFSTAQNASICIRSFHHHSNLNASVRRSYDCEVNGFRPYYYKI